MRMRPCGMILATLLVALGSVAPLARAADDYDMDPMHSSVYFKISHLGLLPHGQPERHKRAISMVTQSQKERFGSCTNIGECEAVCPKSIKLEVIAMMNRDFLRASWSGRGDAPGGD